MTVPTSVPDAVEPVIRQTSCRTGSGLLALPLAVLLTTGCGLLRDSGTAESRTGASPSPSATASPSPTAEPSPSATPTPAPVRLAAADGKRYAACADGTCEVAVAKPVRIKVEGGTLSVTRVKRNDGIDFKLTSWLGGGSGTLKGCGTVVKFYPGGGGMNSSICEPGEVPKRPARERGMLLLQLAGWTSDGAAVLRLVSG